MAELLPEFWAPTRDEAPEKCRFPPRRTRQATDIFTWVQCYVTYVGVLVAKHPEAIPELMAYFISIVRVSQYFVGGAWVRNDAAFHRQAAITENRQGSRINPSLYSLCFAGRAQTSNCCDLCLSSSHTTKDCSLVADLDPELPSRLKAIESEVLALATHQPDPGHHRAVPACGTATGAHFPAAGTCTVIGFAKEPTQQWPVRSRG